MTRAEIISFIVGTLLAGIVAQPLGRKLIDWQRKIEERMKQKKEKKRKERNGS